MPTPKYEKGDTLRFRITTKDFDGNVITPTATPIAKLYKLENETLLNTLTVDNIGTGQYETYYEIPGDFVVYPATIDLYFEWTWSYGGRNFVERTIFRVVLAS